METAYTYNLCGQVEKETVTDVKGNIVMEYSYTHGLNGEILTVEETEGNTVTKVAYTYDKEMRLTGETRSQGENRLSISYTYDAVGNRISKTTTVTGDISGMVNETIEEGKITYTYNAWNQLVSEKQSGTDADYSYDESGAILSLSSDKNITYTYDAKGRLVKYVTRENGTSVITEYTYDYQGTRTSKTVDGKETQYVTYSMNGLSYVLYEMDSLGSVTTEYVRGYQFHTMTRDSETYVYLSDANMDVRALADSEGNLVNRYRYDAWGNTLYAEEEVENPYRYCQEEYDAESGNTYLRARYYNATSANFLSADAYAGSIQNPMTLNKYAYAGANPVMYADPSGYSFTIIETQLRIAMENILRNMEQIHYTGMFCGFASAIDTALSGEGDVMTSFMQGYVTGVAGASILYGLMAFPSIMLEVKMLIGVFQSVGVGLGLYYMNEAWDDGNVPLAVYRTMMTTADIMTLYQQFGPEFANGWRYYFGNAGGQSAGSVIGNSSSERLALPEPTGTNPWDEGSEIVATRASRDCYINMALSPGQTKPGGWGTFDDIPNVNYVRNNLAVTPEFKPEVGYVQRYLVPEGTPIQVGIVGPQSYNGVIYPGQGTQVQILNYSDRMNLVPIGDPYRIY